MLTSETNQKIMIRFMLSNGEGLEISMYLPHDEKTAGEVRKLCEELDRAGTEFLKKNVH